MYQQEEYSPFTIPAHVLQFELDFFLRMGLILKSYCLRVMAEGWIICSAQPCTFGYYLSIL